MSSNVWLDSNKGVIKSIITACLEYHMRGSYGGNIPLDHIVRLFNSALVEIERLQKQIDKLNSKVKMHETILEGQQGPKVSNTIKEDVIKEEK